MPTGLKGPTWYTGHWPKRGGAAPWQILDVDLFCELLSTPNFYGPESDGVRKVMKLSFQPYKDILKRTPYVAVASFLVQIVFGIREGNEIQVVDDSDFNVYVSDAAMSSSVLLVRSHWVPKSSAWRILTWNPAYRIRSPCTHSCPHA